MALPLGDAVDGEARMKKNRKLVFLVFAVLFAVNGLIVYFALEQSEYLPVNAGATAGANTSATAPSVVAATSAATFAAAVAETSAEATAETITEASASTALININTAPLEELIKLSGVGEIIGARIIEYRESAGGFGTIEEITEVKGIGEKTFEKIKDYICV